MLGILVQFKILILPSSVFAWCVTVILPINAAINPYLYTARPRQKDLSDIFGEIELHSGVENESPDIFNYSVISMLKDPIACL